MENTQKEKLNIISKIIDTKELDEVRNDFQIYLKELKEKNFSEYKKIMEEEFNDDYGIIFGPKSFAGIVYKYDTGVIGIDKFGNKEEIIIDGTDQSHSTATLKVGEKLLNNFQNRNNTLITGYDAGLHLSAQGILLLQLEGDCIIVYLPENPTDIQKEVLNKELLPRKDFKVNYANKEKVLEKIK